MRRKKENKSTEEINNTYMALIENNATSKFTNKITIPFADEGLKLPFPQDPQTDGLINQRQGYTIKYKTPIDAGGAYIKMENFNEIINETQKALKETQDKCITSVNGVSPDDSGNSQIPKATETAAGVLELATVDETKFGIDNTDAVTPYALKEAGFRPGSGVFTGALTPSAADRGETFEENGGWWLKCANGARYSKKDFPTLATLMGTTYGPDDPNTFAVPDFTSRAAIGAGTEFPFGTNIEDTMQRMQGFIFSVMQAFSPQGGVLGVFKRLASVQLNTLVTTGSPAWAFDLQFDNALVTRTADHTQTRGVSVYYYVFAGDKATSPAPSNVVATNISATEVQLTWEAPTSGVTPVSYNVYSSDNPFSGYTKKANVTDLTWSDTDIPTTSAMRYYQVSAVSGDGTESSLSDYVSAFFLVAPAAPAVEMRAKDVLITMAGVNIPNTFLSIQQSINGTDWTTVREPADIQTPLSLNAGTYYFRYRYYVGSIDGGYGAATGAIVIGAPDAPILSINSQTKTLSWTNPDNSGLGFVIFRNGNALAETSALTYTVNDMVPGDEYYIESLRAGIATPSNHAYDLIPGIYAGTNDGIYKSVDGGNNWILM